MQGEGERLGQRSGVWKDNPDIKALWKLVAELKDRRLDEQLNADPFVARRSGCRPDAKDWRCGPLLAGRNRPPW